MAENKKKKKKISQAFLAKQKEAAEIKESLQAAKTVVLIDYRGFNVAQDTALRREFRKNNVEYKVLKNTLVRRALNELGFTQFDEILQGPTAVAYGSDIIAPAKIIADSIRATGKMAIKGGIIDGQPASVEEMNKLALIPSKEVLVAQLLCVLTAPIRKLAIALDQVAKK